jgi:aryl-alcohol dehydrogenase-like predicted oxidoreductase
MQMEYSLLQRSVERELIPMANAYDMGIVAWAPIAGGALTGKYLNQNNAPKRLKENSVRLNERNRIIASEVVRIASESGNSPAQVAISWVMSRHQQVIPVVGARNAGQLTDNLKACAVKLDAEHLSHLNEISKIELGYPHDFLNGEGVRDILFGGNRAALDMHHTGF